MFGYVLPDKPNMFMKDYVLFRAYYCGLCHATKKESGQIARFTVNYDSAFLSLLFHDLRREKVTVVEKGCILNPKKRPVIDRTPLMTEVARLNLILAGMKLMDDKADGDKRFWRRVAFSRQIKRARKRSPEIAALADACLEKQIKEEKNGAFLNAAAEPFSDLMRKVFCHFAGEKSSPAVEQLGYLLGKYVYFMDALDDYDVDAAKDRFNAFRRTFGAKSFQELMTEKGEDIRFIMEDIVKCVEDAYREMDMGENEGVVTNVLWYGLRWRIGTVLNKENSKCTRIRL